VTIRDAMTVSNKCFIVPRILVVGRDVRGRSGLLPLLGLADIHNRENLTDD
jgi:hypothetical protein